MKALILFSAATLAAMAQIMPTVPQEALGKAPTARALARDVASPSAASGMLYEALITADSPVFVPAGGFQILASHLDYTGVGRIAVSLLSLDNVDLSLLHVSPAWAAPGLWYTLTDLSGGMQLLGGGMSTSVYGPFLKITLLNTSTVPLPVKQLTVYAVPARQQ